MSYVSQRLLWQAIFLIKFLLAKLRKITFCFHEYNQKGNMREGIERDTEGDKGRKMLGMKAGMRLKKEQIEKII